MAHGNTNSTYLHVINIRRNALRIRNGSFFFLHSDVTGKEGGMTSSFFFRVTEQTSWRKKKVKNSEQRN
jgi:hypothetical protein